MKKINLLFFLLITIFMNAQTTSNFENVVLQPESFYNGSDLAGGFSSGNALFFNDYDTAWASWSGFACSNITDTVTSGFQNQYSAITGKGVNGSSNYAVGVDYGSATVTLSGISAGKMLRGVYVTNATYAYRSMLDGDFFAKKFGGATGSDPDWFKLKVTGSLNGVPSTKEVEFYLADYRYADNDSDFVVSTWQWLDLEPLGNVDQIQFLLSSSDTGQFGMNTPAYFCIDNLTSSDLVNTSPVANNDIVNIHYLQDTLLDVLANDYDFTATPLTLSWVGEPLAGGAQITIIDNKLLYKPAIGIVTLDSVAYAVCDAAGLCDTASILLTIGNPLSISTLSKTAVSVYPNPFYGQITITSDMGIEKVIVLNTLGAIVEEAKGENMQLYTLQTQYWKAGIYFIQAYTSTGVTQQMVVKQ